MEQPISAAFSPCPNDTFIFHGWVHNLFPAEFPIKPVLADIQHLNQWLHQSIHPISKGSISCLKDVLSQYILLPVGAALGYGCGPKIISKNPTTIKELANKSIAIPGIDTTAHRLLQLLLPPFKHKKFCLYHEVLPLLKSGEVDAGLIIHETRFTFAQHGFTEILDLGSLWEQQFQLPLPLGGIFAKRSLGDPFLNAICNAIHTSLTMAFNNPNQSKEYILKHSQEQNEDAIQKHIDLYVNKESLGLSKKGIEGIQLLLDVSLKGTSMLPKINQSEWLYQWEP